MQPPVDTLPPIPLPRLTRRGVLLASVGWVLYGLLYSLLLAVNADIPLRWALGSQFVYAAVLAVLSVPVWWFIVRGLDRSGWKARMAAHVVAGPLYALGSYGLYVGLLAVTSGPMAVQAVQAQAEWIVFGILATYGVQFGIYHALRAGEKSRVRAQQAAAAQALAREQELRALRAQINPHFLFNTLHTISATAPEATREQIATLADLLRYTLDAGARLLVPLREELDFARAYLALVQQRFSDRLRVEIEVDEAALETPVPPVVLQPLLENAVKHGISDSEQGGTIRLEIRVQGGRVEVSVEDTGAGTAGPVGLGIGLKNTEARLRHFFGDAARLSAGPMAPQGFRAAFTLPLSVEAVSAHPQLR